MRRRLPTEVALVEQRPFGAVAAAVAVTLVEPARVVVTFVHVDLDLLDTTLSELGNLTAGLALFVTGLVLSAQHLTLTSNVAVSTLVGDIARPLLAFLIVKALGLTAPMAAEPSY